MSDLNEARRQNLNLVAGAPPTQLQGLPEVPPLQQVRAEAEFLPLIADDQAIRELYAKFGVKSADDLAETDCREFIRLANMSCEERAEVVASKRTVPRGPLDLRFRLLNNGFAPRPAEGKAIRLKGWQAANITSEAIDSWERGKHQSHRNTGVRTKHTPAFDIDIKEEAAAEAVEAMVRERFGGRGKLLVRIGMAPKRVRTESPFKKISRNLIAADGSAGQTAKQFSHDTSVELDAIEPDRIRAEESIEEHLPTGAVRSASASSGRRAKARRGWTAAVDVPTGVGFRR
jgi:hypothetical protein